MKMNSEERTADVLAAHADELLGRPGATQRIDVTDEERRQLAPLFDLAEQIRQSMPPVRPPAAFVHSLGRELAKSAEHQVAATKRMRRGVLIGAAAVGSLVSIASVAGATILVISRLRARAHARAPMG